MQDVAGLGGIPPAEVFDIHADFFESGPGLFDLDLRAAMRQHERHMAIQENFHHGLVSGTADYSWKTARKEKLFWLAFFDDLIDANDSRAGGDIVSHDGIGADDAAASNAAAADDFCARSDEDIILDDGGLVAGIFGADGDLVKNDDAFTQNGRGMDDDAVRMGHDETVRNLATDVAVENNSPETPKKWDIVTEKKEQKPRGGGISGIEQHHGHGGNLITVSVKTSKYLPSWSGAGTLRGGSIQRVCEKVATFEISRTMEEDFELYFWTGARHACGVFWLLEWVRRGTCVRVVRPVHHRPHRNRRKHEFQPQHPSWQSTSRPMTRGICFQESTRFNTVRPMATEHHLKKTIPAHGNL
jgi:hypothetical protein